MEDNHHHNSSQPLCHVDSSQVFPSPPIQVRVQLVECVVAMEVDTGAAVSLMSEATFMRLWPDRELLPTEVCLQAYCKQPIPVVGFCKVNVHYETQTMVMPPSTLLSDVPLLAAVVVVVEVVCTGTEGRKLDWFTDCPRSSRMLLAAASILIASSAAFI